MFMTIVVCFKSTDSFLTNIRVSFFTYMWSFVFRQVLMASVSSFKSTYSFLTNIQVFFDIFLVLCLQTSVYDRRLVAPSL